MITCNLMGGLGNQLFQIFTTISLSMKTTNSFIFSDTYILDNGKRHTYWDTLLFRLKPFLRPFVNVFVKDNGTVNIFVKDNGFDRNLTILKEHGFEYNNIPLHKLMGADTCLHGYFQSYKYFDDTFPSIYRMLHIEEQKKSVALLLGDIEFGHKEFGNNTISLHFRLGDYKALPHVYPILTMAYYEKAIELICKKTMNNKFTIFYFCEDDDLMDVLQIVDLLKDQYKECNFIRCPIHLKDWEQVLLMSSCSHNVIANSTFSWWGAYLNRYKNKIVCYPDVWFQEAVGYNTKDLCPSDWFQVKNV
jgi:hypothetical protein